VLSSAGREGVITFSEAWNGLGMKLAPRLIGYNSKDFDLPVLLINLMRHGLSLRPRIGNAYDSHLDLRGAICGFRGKGTLKALTNNFGIDEYDPTENGAMVLPLLLAGKLDEIEEYCRKDVLATAELFLRLSKVLGI
jgi:predicted PolB exonuclease-like 3'-5' exonuclease